MAFLQQTDPVAGQPVTVTLPYLDQNGTLQMGQIKVAPGKDAVLPDNILTSDEIQNYVLGNLGSGDTDQKAVGVHWNGYADIPMMVVGSLKDQKYSSLLGTNQNGLYLTNFGNIIPEMPAQSRMLLQPFTATGVQDGNTITFPQAFTSDDVKVFITPKTPSATGSWSPPICGCTNINRYGFGLTRFFTDGTPKTSVGDISILAIGKIGA